MNKEVEKSLEALRGDERVVSASALYHDHTDDEIIWKLHCTPDYGYMDADTIFALSNLVEPYGFAWNGIDRDREAGISLVFR